jgi:signal peptidase I
VIRKALSAVAAVGIATVVVFLTFGTNHSYVTTPSMYPTIPPGSEIVVEHEQRYHVGQVIEFHANGLTWAHRLIKIDPDGDFHTKGDNPVNSPDIFVPAVTQADVVGAIVHAPRWVGFPELIVHHPAYGMSWLRAELGLRGKLVLIGLAAILAFFLATGGFGGSRKRSRRTRHHRRLSPST